MKDKIGSKAGAEEEKPGAIKISPEVKKLLDLYHRETGRTRLHIVNAAVREYCANVAAKIS